MVKKLPKHYRRRDEINMLRGQRNMQTIYAKVKQMLDKFDHFTKRVHGVDIGAPIEESYEQSALNHCLKLEDQSTVLIQRIKK